MTIGGNDAGFADELTNCILSPIQCTGREAELQARIDGTYLNANGAVRHLP